MINFKFAVWQSYYNNESFKHLDKGFTPYNNTKCTIFYENDIIVDIHDNMVGQWKNADYVGLLSWRFEEKTDINSDKVYSHISNSANKPDVYILNPKVYKKYGHLYNDKGFGNINAICKIVDKKKIFPFKLAGCDVGDYNTFCNFFICTPEVFQDYVNNYLKVFMNWLLTCNDPEFLYQIKLLISHRHTLYTAHTFMLEGLFSCYANYKKLSFDLIDSDTVIIKNNPNTDQELVKDPPNVIRKKALNSFLR